MEFVIVFILRCDRYNHRYTYLPVNFKNPVIERQDVDDSHLRLF